MESSTGGSRHAEICNRPGVQKVVAPRWHGSQQNPNPRRRIEIFATLKL
jgi:hypothetical protein